ncbi:kinase binding protein CGI-121-domain-containing protein [Massariosphaeria phaeospora]|uniref:EKC/KEOPS complex subunit CGI121 n=1 Tax=Massariosphaeria phaeospora TaxID=100035 RepID=A0A7C8IFG5_9PLEO|nr:kinase binding protein CGI-121-domain-containing protein [Massariosphaeria phaeospora]
MASVRTFHLPHYPAYPVQVALFKDVANAAFLRSQLLEANPDFDYAFLDATMILTPNHLLSATFLALHASQTSRTKTRTAHSELVFRLHPNNNIGESYRKFGISDTTTHLIAVKFSLTPNITNESVSKHLGEFVKGESVAIGEEGEELGIWCDVGKVRKVYKLGEEKKTKKGAVVNGNVEMDARKEIESVVLGMITLKGS